MNDRYKVIRYFNTNEFAVHDTKAVGHMPKEVYTGREQQCEQVCDFMNEQEGIIQDLMIGD